MLFTGAIKQNPQEIVDDKGKGEERQPLEDQFPHEQCPRRGAEEGVERNTDEETVQERENEEDVDHVGAERRREVEVSPPAVEGTDEGEADQHDHNAGGQHVEEVLRQVDAPAHIGSVRRDQVPHLYKKPDRLGKVREGDEDGKQEEGDDREAQFVA